MGLLGNEAMNKLSNLVNSSNYKNLLKSHGLDEDDSKRIIKKVEEEIKHGFINETNVGYRIEFLVENYNREFNQNISLNESSENIKSCPECKQDQDIGNAYCSFCGYKFTDIQSTKQIKCPICNSLQSIDNKFCISCGFNLKESISSNKDDEQKEDKNNSPKKSFKIPKRHSISKFDAFKRNAIFLTNFDFNIKLCPQCNSELLSGDKFCYNCGLDVENVEKASTKPIKPKLTKHSQFKRRIIFSSNFNFNLKLCPNCNSELLFDDNFCYKCGEKVTNNEINDIKKPVPVPETNQSSEHKIVKTNYDSNFKIALALYLEEFRKNPKKGFSQTIAKNYETSVDDLKKQAIDDEFIELESPLAVASNLKLTDIKEVLKSHGLKVSGKKDELIERLGENLSEEELNNTFKPENYQITDKGLEFINNNQYLIYLHNNSEISQLISPSVCINLFEEREYPQEEIYATFINYFNNSLSEELNNGNFDNFENYTDAIASILKDQGNLKESLIMRFNVFLFNINNYSKDLQPIPSETKIKSKDKNHLIDLIVKLDESPEEVMKLFAFSCHEFPFKRMISDEDSWKYFVKIINGEDLKRVSKEINDEYS